MQSTTDFLSDAAFFQEAVDFLDMNCFSPTSLSFNEDEMLAIPEIIETTSNILSPRSSDTSADSSERDRAFVALKTYREKEKLRRRKQRQRIRDELESMRRKEDELSRLLKKMKLHKETRLSSGEQHSIWKEVALTQRDQRLKSETEQRRLITTVKDQASYIKQLRGLFHTHQNLPSFMNALGTSALSGGIASQLGASDVPVFTSLLQAIDASCASFDDIMNGCGVVAMSLGIVNSTHWNSGSENTQKLLESFNYQHHQCDRKTYSGLGNTENTIAIKYRLWYSGLLLVGSLNRIEFWVFGKHTQKARGYFAGCIQVKQDGVAYDRCQIDPGHSVKFVFVNSQLTLTHPQ
ncbi:Hypothetical protein PHPALM_15731 [Phytophthora palmivora]|uniref:Uncharacterized protein n=1 Tax=Phytophthora palmivora TaxID=4796 RepID=A0A2P4XRE7_9STRA|nr:Hypothetical protein PHPALM_15731 [Phytophthora palmivora]